MPASHTVGTCEECHKMFEYTLLHNGVNNSSYGYCDRCGKTAILDVSHPRFPVEQLKSSAYKAIEPGMEPHLKPCDCGGKFLSSAAPMCPHCSSQLSPTAAAAYMERNPPKGSPNWRWQMNWKGNYCIVIEGKQERNNFL